MPIVQRESARPIDK